MTKIIIAALASILVAGAVAAPASAGTDLMQSYYIR